MPIAVAAQALLLAAVLFSAVTDLLERRILNTVTFPLVVVGIAVHAIAAPLGTWWQGIAGLLAVGIPFFAIYAVGGGAIFGAGDVKLLMAVGAIAGVKLGLTIGIVSILFGGVLSLAALVLTARLGDVLRMFTKSRDPKTSLKLPFGVAIAAATTLLLSAQGMQ